MNEILNISECHIEDATKPEHKALIESAEKDLREYEEYLLLRLKDRHNISANIYDPAKRKAMSIDFMEDRYRNLLIKHIAGLKILFERRKIIVKAGVEEG